MWCRTHRMATRQASLMRISPRFIGRGAQYTMMPAVPLGAFAHATAAAQPQAVARAGSEPRINLRAKSSCAYLEACWSIRLRQRAPRSQAAVEVESELDIVRAGLAGGR
jgi:hypothetical protein